MTGARGGPGSGPSAALATWLHGLGPLARARPAPSLDRAVAGAGGALAATGFLVLGADHWASSGSAGPAVVLAAAVLAAGLAVVVRAPEPYPAAGVSASGLAAPALAFFLAASGGGFPSVRLVALLAGVLLAGVYALGPWRGHTFHLAILAAAGWGLAVSVGDLGTGGPFDGVSTVAEVVARAGSASMIVGVVYLGLGSWLHDEGLEGMATPLLAVAAAALPLGAVALLRDTDDALQAAVVAAAGAAVALVGARGARRGTTWAGVATTAAGAAALARAVGTRVPVTGALLVLAGLGLALLAARAPAPPPRGPSGAIEEDS